MVKCIQAFLLIFVLLLAIVHHCQAASNDTQNTWLAIQHFHPDIPANAVLGGGSTTTGFKFFVGRLTYQNSVKVARVIQETGTAFFDDEGADRRSTIFEVLIGNKPYEWIRSFDGLTEPNAVSVGTDFYGRQVFICRVLCVGGAFMGHLTRGTFTCNLSDNVLGCQVKDRYEILAVKQ